MTVAEVILSARERYNAVGETFWSDSELMRLIYSACLELSTETLCIQRKYTTSTVASQEEYAYPTSCIAIKRLTCDGRKLKKLSKREDDAVTISNASTAQTGSVQYYSDWNYTLSLRPIPDAIYTLQIFSINEPQPVTSASTLEIPTTFHMRLVNYLLSEMYAKDKDFNTASFYRSRWEKDKVDVKKWVKFRERTDSLTTVLEEESLPETYMGAI